MILRPLPTAADYELAAAWLANKENGQWLDFGNSRYAMSVGAAPHAASQPRL
jgi:hypothetical protein